MAKQSDSKTAMEWIRYDPVHLPFWWWFTTSYLHISLYYPHLPRLPPSESGFFKRSVPDLSFAPSGSVLIRRHGCIDLDLVQILASGLGISSAHSAVRARPPKLLAPSSFLFLVARMLLVVMPFVTSSVLVTSSKARSAPSSVARRVQS